jgi:hypothetical protein
LAVAAILATGFTAKLTLLFNLSKFCLALETGADCFWGLIEEKFSDEPVLEREVSFFSSVVFFNGEILSSLVRELFWDEEFF